MTEFGSRHCEAGGSSRPCSVVQCRPSERPVVAEAADRLVEADDGSYSPKLLTKILRLLSKADLERIATLFYDPADAN